MSLYEVQQCLFDYLRVLCPGGPEDAGSPGDQHRRVRPDRHRAGCAVNKDVGAIDAMGTHPVIINGYCRALGYKKADYRPLEAAASKAEPRRTRWQTP